MPLPCLAISAKGDPAPDLHLSEPQSTTILVRVVSHGSMVLGREVGSARITITDVATKQILATGIQQGEAGDQNQIMRTRASWRSRTIALGLPQPLPRPSTCAIRRWLR